MREKSTRVLTHFKATENPDADNCPHLAMQTPIWPKYTGYECAFPFPAIVCLLNRPFLVHRIPDKAECLSRHRGMRALIYAFSGTLLPLALYVGIG